MRVSDDLFEFHKMFEGYHNKAYKDPVGILTIGVGHANQDVEPFDEDAEWNDDKIRDVWLRDVKCAEERALKYIGVLVEPDDIPQSWFNAVVDIIFNTGRVPKTMLMAIDDSKGDPAFSGVVAEQLLRWVYAGKKIMFGLIRRRFSMYAMIMGKDWRALANAYTLDDFNDALFEQGINFEVVKDPDTGYSIVEV